MTEETDPVENRSLLAYLRAYAAGQIDHDQMIDTVAAWPLRDTDRSAGDPSDYVPDLDENSAAVLSAAVTMFGWITDADYQEIADRRAAAPPDPASRATS